MSKLTDLEATRQALQELADIMQTTRRLLLVIISDTDLPGKQLSSFGFIRQRRPQSGDLFKALTHIETVREGFLLSHRTDTSEQVSTLRDLVAHVLMDWDWLQSLNLSVELNLEVDQLDQQLIFFNHALVALGALPHLPADAVTFPQRQPTYADVTAPAEPSELLKRIEEIERTIYQMDIMPHKTPQPGPLRRTYAFFEASSWLVDQHLKPLRNYL